MRITFKGTIKGMVRITCNGTIKCMVIITVRGTVKGIVRITVKGTMKGMPRITCKGTVRGMVIKGMVRNTVMSTVNSMVAITISHVGCLRQNQRDRGQENKLICPLTTSVNIYTHTIRQSQHYVAIRKSVYDKRL